MYLALLKAFGHCPIYAFRVEVCAELSNDEITSTLQETTVS